MIDVNPPEVALSRRCPGMHRFFGASRLQFYPVNFADKQRLITFRQRIENTHGVGSLWLNKADVAQPNYCVGIVTFVDSTACQYHDVLALNVDTRLRVPQVFAELILSHGYGLITNIGGMDGIGDKLTIHANLDFSSIKTNACVDSGSKAMLANFTKYLPGHCYF